MTAPPTYLKRRRLGWYVQLPVPSSRQAAMGCKVLTRSLQTRDPLEAQRLRHKVIAELQALVLSVEPAVHEVTSQTLLDSARRARAAVDAGSLSVADAVPSFDAAVEDFLEAQGRVHGVDDEGAPLVPASAIAAINRAHGTLTGNPALTVGYQAERWLGQVAASALTRQTVGDKERHLESFLDWIGRETECRRITRAQASRYVDDAVSPRPLSQQTKRVAVNVARQFFEWLEARDLVNLNPFANAGKLLQDSKRGKEQARRPWTGAELLAVLNHIPEEDPLWPLVALGAYTGARREDLCSLKIDAVSNGFLQIREGKTAAAVRRVPIHSVIAGMVDRLTATSSDGFLLPGLLSGGSDSRRGHYIGKRFSYAKQKAGVTDPRVVFHAFRNSVLSQLDAAGVELSLRQQLVGHERGTVTDKAYTAPAADSRRAAALAHVSYGESVDAHVRAVGGSLTLTHTSRRRRAA